jgi:serine protease Do
MKTRASRTWCTIILALAVAPPTLQAQRPSRDRALAELGGLSEAFESLSARVNPAVVQILAVGYQPPQTGDPPGSGLLMRRRVGGSGVILDPSGYIVTNLHVIDGAERVQVRLPIPVNPDQPDHSILKARGRLVGARIVGVDRETDLAVLRVDQTGLPHLELGDSDGLGTGQLVFAFGSPRGLDNSVTMGVVSAVARQLRPEDPMIYIQTDAPINPGNSGGPLVDAEGNVVGINTFIISESGGSEGLGFAAPSNIVSNVYRQIRNIGYVRRGTIGVYAQTISPALAEGLGLPRQWGVILGDVYPGGPAERAGLQVGDIVLALGGKPMENGRQLDVNVYGTPIGERVGLEVLRGEGRVEVSVVVLERDDDVNRFFPMVNPEENLIPRLGILAVDLTPQVAAMLPTLRMRSGVVVAARSPDASYGETELLPGDVIHEINDAPLNRLQELRRLMSEMPPGSSLVLQVERRGRLRYVALEPD